MSWRGDCDGAGGCFELIRDTHEMNRSRCNKYLRSHSLNHAANSHVRSTTSAFLNFFAKRAQPLEYLAFANQTSTIIHGHLRCQNSYDRTQQLNSYLISNGCANPPFSPSNAANPIPERERHPTSSLDTNHKHIPSPSPPSSRLSFSSILTRSVSRHAVFATVALAQISTLSGLHKRAS